MKKLITYALVMFVVNVVYPAQTCISFEQLFPEKKQRQMGLHKLTDKEKEALRLHVEDLLIQIASVSNTKQKAAARGKISGSVYAFIGGGHWIKKNVDRGTYLILEDGSVWQVDPLNKIEAMLWLPISNITVTESVSGSPGYDYLLINTDDGEKVHAKFINNTLSQTDNLSFFGIDGKAIAYIDVTDGFTIYLWLGKPVAYLDDESIYGFNGKHLGWINSGIIYDHNGYVIAANASAFKTPPSHAAAKGVKDLKPLKGLKELKPLKPIFGSTWSNTPAVVFFLKGVN